MSLTLGIDIGGTKIAAGLVQSDGSVVRSETTATPAREGAAAILQAAVRLARGVMGDDCVAAAGVGSGGQIDVQKGIVVSATDLLPGWAGMPLRKNLSNALDLPVFLDNDVNALASGEARFGAARGLETVIFLALGTGVGGALLIDGRLHHGAHWTGGEFGHILLSIDPKARRDSGGSTGTLEAYASGHGLVVTYREIAVGHPTLTTGEEVAAEARSQPEGPAAAAIAMTGEYLGYGLVSLANALDPSLIVVGGGMAALGDMLLGPARRILRQRALPGPSQVKVVPTALGQHASVIGAASLAMAREGDTRKAAKAPAQL